MDAADENTLLGRVLLGVEHRPAHPDIAHTPPADMETTYPPAPTSTASYFAMSLSSFRARTFTLL